MFSRGLLNDFGDFKHLRSAVDTPDRFQRALLNLLHIVVQVARYLTDVILSVAGVLCQS